MYPPRPRSIKQGTITAPAPPQLPASPSRASLFAQAAKPPAPRAVPTNSLLTPAPGTLEGNIGQLAEVPGLQPRPAARGEVSPLPRPTPDPDGGWLTPTNLALAGLGAGGLYALHNYLNSDEDEEDPRGPYTRMKASAENFGLAALAARSGLRKAANPLGRLSQAVSGLGAKFERLDSSPARLMSGAGSRFGAAARRTLAAPAAVAAKRLATNPKVLMAAPVAGLGATLAASGRGATTPAAPAPAPREGLGGYLDAGLDWAKSNPGLAAGGLGLGALGAMYMTSRGRDRDKEAAEAELSPEGRALLEAHLRLTNGAALPLLATPALAAGRGLIGMAGAPPGHVAQRGARGFIRGANSGLGMGIGALAGMIGGASLGVPGAGALAGGGLGYLAGDRFGDWVAGPDPSAPTAEDEDDNKPTNS